ncbi:abortive phage infection protein [Micromonospora echinospora]|uniref:AIPR protein n=1 Tax=Micromonospora echinospora TaxID=1877 RepID=A0A1C4YGM7_MICEC|nr:AIPR family protein [Micromonospora echinospora]OZV81155.1 abortive phage infection protein [Micromonospora echinospora]SCF19882.1 AIPR protein [Micromonospora echinospora]
MSSAGRRSGTRDTALQVRQVEAALRTTYINDGLLNLEDLEGRPDEERTPRALSRALAAQAVRIVTGWTPQDSALTVIDGVADQGIDAIAVVEKPDPHVYLVQAKWSKNGNASADRSAVMELLAGLRLIDDEDFAPFNLRGRILAEQAKNVMSQGPVPVTQVVVLMRADDVPFGFLDAIRGGEREFNRLGNVLDSRIILAPEVWASVREDMSPRPVELEAELFPWFTVSTPYVSYQGVAEAAQVAQWVEHGTNLFNLNIRNPLGRTPINNEMIDTLMREPGNFWYFNNGVTILCESVESVQQAIRSPHSRPIKLTLHNASVVNGAQTVRSIAEAVSTDEESGSAQVGVRVIVTGKAVQFAKQATQATNRQNRVEARDFIALDPVQAVILEDMRAELGLDYSVRRGELEPQPDTGCSVVEAACALACAHPDSQYAARIATTLDVLWERGSQGIYDVLFRPQLGVYALWNAVLVLRQVRRVLHELRPLYTGRGAALIEHGGYLLAHLVFRRLDTEAIDEPDSKLEWAKQAVEQVQSLVEGLLPTVAAAIDELYTDRAQIRVVCSDVTRCREIAEHVLDPAGATPSPSGNKYRRLPPGRKRRPNAVSVLVDKAVLPEGEALTFVTPFASEAEALRDWLAETPKRGRATWVPHRGKPILWAADGQRYSPSGLISHMWELAGWENRPVANQGTARWAVSSGETLADLAWRVLRELGPANEVD